MGLIAPIMYVVLKQKGFEIIEIGLLIILSSMTTVLSEVPFGLLSDRIGRKKMFIAGQLAFITFCIGMIYTDNFMIMSLCMIMAGTSTAMSSGTLDALFIDTLNAYKIQPNVMQESIAKLGAASMVGLLFGAVASGFVGDLIFENGHRTSFESNYVVVAFLIPFLLLLVHFLINEDRKHTSNSIKDHSLNILQSIKNKNALFLMMFSSSIGAVAFISFEKFWQLELSSIVEDNNKKWMFGVLFSLSIISGIIGQLLSVKLCSWFNNNYIKTLTLIRVLQGILFCLLFIDHNLLGFSIIFVLIFFVSSLSQSPVLTLFHHEVEENERSTMLSIRSIFLQCGAIIGIIIASIVTHFASLELTFVISGAIYFISISLLYSNPMQDIGIKLSSSSL